MRSFSRSSTRRISPWPGRNARIEPDSRARPASQRPPSDPRCARWHHARDNASRPERRGLRRRDRPDQRPARRPASPTSAGCAGRPSKPRWQSSARASPRSASSELVEQHRADAGKARATRIMRAQHALGDDLDACLRPRFRNGPRAQSDPLADSLRQGAPAMQLGCGPRGEAARLQHEDLAARGTSFRPSKRGGRGWSRRRRVVQRERPRRARSGFRAIRRGWRQSEGGSRSSWRYIHLLISLLQGQSAHGARVSAILAICRALLVRLESAFFFAALLGNVCHL